VDIIIIIIIIINDYHMYDRSAYYYSEYRAQTHLDTGQNLLMYVYSSTILYITCMCKFTILYNTKLLTNKYTFIIEISGRHFRGKLFGGGIIVSQCCPGL